MKKIKGGSVVNGWTANLKTLRPAHICLGIGALGFSLVVLGFATVWTTGWGKDLFAPGATLLTVALTAWIASLGVISWQEQKKRDRESKEFERREKVYSEIATFMLQRFLSRDRTPEQRKDDLWKDAELRSHAALWASPETVHMLAYWQTLLSQFDGSLTPMQSEWLKQSIGRTLEAMREDLSPMGKDDLRRDVMLKSIFND
ncbi:hypothetical protein M1D89_07335 [Arthrobacter sp. D3-18]